MKDVAEIAHVHPATVSRVFDPDPAKRRRISDATAERVEAAAKALGYQTNHVARSLRMGRSFTVAVVIPDLTNPLYPALVRGISDFLEPRGYTALVANTDAESEREVRSLAGYGSWPVAGFIGALAPSSRAAVEAVIDDHTPVVLINRTIGSDRTSAVVADDRQGAILAVRHLVALGHRSIAHIGGPQDLSPAQYRYEGYLAGLREHGLSADDHLVEFAGSFKRGAGVSAVKRLLESGAYFSAVFAAADLLALDCVAQLRAEGRVCPDDVSIVGFDDIPYADLFTPPLTTVGFSHYDVGRSAAQLLLDQLSEDRAGIRTITLPTALVTRGSTAPVGSAAPGFAE